MTTVTISLPEPLREFVESQLSKGYGNISEYFRSLLRAAQEKEQGLRLEALLLEGLTSGESIPMNETFWEELKADAAQLAKKHRDRKQTK